MIDSLRLGGRIATLAGEYPTVARLLNCGTPAAEVTVKTKALMSAIGAALAQKHDAVSLAFDAENQMIELSGHHLGEKRNGVGQTCTSLAAEDIIDPPNTSADVRISAKLAGALDLGSEVKLCVSADSGHLHAYSGSSHVVIVPIGKAAAR